jgi:putative oxidoreductase
MVHPSCSPGRRHGRRAGWHLAVLAGFLIELVLGLLILVGLFTRIAAFTAAGEMAAAQFWQHQPNGLHPLENGSGPAVLFGFAFLQLVFTGGGLYSPATARFGRLRR